MKALIITGKYVQDHEFIYPFYRLQEEGYEVHVATMYKEIVFGAVGIRIVPTHDISLINEDECLKVEDYHVLILPGGAKAMEYMRQEQKILNFISNFHKTGKVIGSICHAAQLLISAGLVKGRLISGYYSIRDDINNAGGTYVDGVVTDSRIVSAPHYKHLGTWMRAVLREAGGQ